MPQATPAQADAKGIGAHITWCVLATLVLVILAAAYSLPEASLSIVFAWELWTLAAPG